MATSTRDLAILLLEGGCSRLFLPPSAGEELYAFLEMCRENEASRQNISPSSKLDALWHWMLLNTDVSTRVHEALGGIVPHTTSTESDSLEKKNKRRKLSMKLMNSMGYSPNPDLWDDDSTREEENENDFDDSCYNCSPRMGDVSDGYRSKSWGSSILSHMWKRKDENAFRVNVQLVGNGKRIVLEGLTAFTTVEELACAVHDMEGIPQDQQRLFYNGRQMIYTATLGDYGVVDDAIIHLSLRLRGC